MSRYSERDSDHCSNRHLLGACGAQGTISLRPSPLSCMCLCVCVCVCVCDSDALKCLVENPVVKGDVRKLL